MKKIEKLSQKDIDRLPLVRDKWLKIGLSTDTNKENAEAAIKDVYASANLSEPKLKIWLDSPIAGCLGAFYLTKINEILKDNQTIGDQVWNQVRNQVWNQVWNQVRNQVRGQVVDQVWNQVRGQVGDQVCNQVGDQVGDQVWNQVRNQVWNQVWNQVRNQVRGQMKDQVGNQVRNQVGDQVWNQVWRAGYGLHDSGWLSFYDFFKDLFPETIQPLKGLLELSQHCGWWWPFENAVIFTPKPTLIKRDEENRLHCENGPALSYPEGWSLYVWHGVRIPEEWIKNPDSVHPKIALTWENVEQRRCIFEILGWEKILAHCKTTIIATDNRGELLVSPTFDDDDGKQAKFVKFTCPSTGREYIHRVDPNVKTPTEAIASMWGLTEEQYQPIRES